MTRTKIYFITSNKHKFDEVNAIVGNLEMVKLELPELQSLSFEEIIRAKLAEAVKHGYSPCIVDDTGYECDGLHGLPGPFSKFFRDKLNNDELYRVLTAGKSTRAVGKTIIGYADKEHIQFFEGSVHCTIVPARGTNGFGMDPLMQPDGYEKTFAELSPEEKNALSMRGNAARKLQEWLVKQP